MKSAVFAHTPSKLSGFGLKVTSSDRVLPDFDTAKPFLKIISTFGKISFEFAAVMPSALKLKHLFSPSFTVIPE